MRNLLLGLAAILYSFTMTAQSVDDVVSIGAGYVNQVYYSLSNDEQGSNALNGWDLAFDVSFYGVGIRANTANGLEIAKYPGDLDDWDDVTIDEFDNWEKLNDNPLVWDDGALNAGSDDDVNVGWGAYNSSTHNTVGHTIFIVKLPAASFKKLRIDSQAAGSYYFTYANIDGSDEVSESIAKSDYTGKNFAYYSMQTQAASDFEPLANNWDLVFGKYTDLVPTAYTVTGIRQNKNVEIAQLDGVNPSEITLADADSEDFSTDINTIGHDWKVVDINTGSWSVEQEKAYIVKTRDNKYYKFVLTGFGGASNGEYQFTKEFLENAVGVSEYENPLGFFFYPNPVSGELLQVVIDNNQREELTLVIADMQGRIVKNEIITSAGRLETISLNVSEMAPGLYHFSVISRNGVMSKKLIVK